MLGVSPSEQVIIGEKGWLYYNSKADGDPIGCYRGTLVLNEVDLETISFKLEAWRNWLKNRGIPLVLMFPPNTPSVYPEFLPRYVTRVKSETMLDQVVVHLKKNAPYLDVVDLRKTLSEKKSFGPLYYNNGTHWTRLGAFFAYRELFERINPYFPGMIPLSLEDYDVNIESINWGLESFIRILGVFDGPGPNIEVHMNPKFSVSYKVLSDHSVGNLRRDYVTVQDAPGLPSCVIFGDSFTQFLIPFISQHFNRAVYVWSRELDPNLIESETPNLVLLIVTERYVPFLKMMASPK